MFVVNEFIQESLDHGSSEKAVFDKPKKEESSETKKCSKCLKRVSLHYERCPYCRSRQFWFNDA
jgi:Zn finger protein HypA/HybF involved in hydrogenase expression